MLQIISLITIVFISVCSSLQVVNITSAVKLTDLFLPEFNQNDISFSAAITGGITTYKNPSDSSTEYLFTTVYGTEYNYTKWPPANGSPVTSFIKADILSLTTLSQYNGLPNKNNPLPFKIEYVETKYPNEEDYDGSLSCTSPTTGDIITCTIHLGNIMCKIYFVETNTFTDNIIISVGDPLGPVCFNDSYFIPYSKPYKNELRKVDGYAAFLDLNGNLVYNDVELTPQITDHSVSPSGISFGGDKFKFKNVDNNKLFQIVNLNLTALNSDYGPFEYYLMYYYYTNINETKDNLIKIYNQTEIEMGSIYYYVYGAATLDLKNDCCYVSMYFDEQPGNIYALITDIYGQIVVNFTVIASVDKYERDLNQRFKMIDLPKLSTDDNLEYFAVTDYSDTYLGSYIDIFSLSSSYEIKNIGMYKTWNISETSDPDNTPGEISVYHLKNTNNIYYIWSQFREAQGDAQIYGQGFEIKN